ncbi:MAG: translation initiation factor IF-2 [Desulfobulbaceae bacterium]|nr:translation initiation factor IF-2 [Desulfobulbaceae bacterium]
MSRVRVYELAKEAGMSSKALTEKLVELGYDIKGHSSSVDDDTAEKIRSTVLKSANTELVEKRIDSSEKKKGATVIRRRATVIRRRATVKEESAEDETEIEDEMVDEPLVEDQKSDIPVETQVAEEVAPVVAEPEGAEDIVSEDIVSEKIAEEVAEETPEPVAEQAIQAAPEPEVESLPEEKVVQDVPVEEPIQDMAPAADIEAEKVVTKEDPAAPKVEAVGEAASADKVAEEPKKKPKKVKVQPAKKPMARVIRTIELPKQEETKPARPKKKVSKPPQQRRGVQPPANTPPAPSDDSARGRKKGKKGKGATEDRDVASRRGAKKGQKNVKFTHFSQDYQGRDGGKRGKKGRRGAKVVMPPSEMKASKKRFKVYDTISVGDLAQKMKVKAGDVIAKLMSLGVMATINQPVDTDTAMIIASDFGYEVEQGVTEEIGMQLLDDSEEGGEQESRSPVVTVMGHVDHGKTSILDAIRKTDVADGEAGGITQHIGAYHVRSAAGDVTFVDTPGHAAFTEMRSRGAQVTDIVILVVAADDGVMDQTREAIHHAQAAEVPIIVAVNKIDKDNADPDRVKRELSELNLMPEDWGGDTMFCDTSAKQNIGIDNLLESIQLLAEILELRADSNRKAKGRVVEAQLHKGRGSVATVLIQDGTLKLGEHFVVGQFSGKVRAMLDDKGRNLTEAGPAIPVEVQGLAGVPSAGDEFIVVSDEKMARNVSQVRSLKARESELGANSKISLDKLFEQMSEGDVKELRVVLRSDVQGTLEAFAKAAEDLSTKEIKVKILHEGTGTITESDILLASASDAIIIGFNVRPNIKVKELATKENVDVRSYDVIYHALDDIRKAMVGMLDPTFEEEVVGLAEVRDTFSVPKVGTIAGCSVIDGKILRTAKVRVLRDGVVIYTGKIESLRRFKDDVKEVLSGYECGIGVEKFNDIKIGDNLEAFIMKEIEATL